MTAGRMRYLPSAYCYYGHPESAQFFCATDANGTAAGNTIEEAILQGAFELIERDAVALWWYNRVARPHVDIESFRVPYTASLRRHYEAIGREFWVLDLTHDLDVAYRNVLHWAVADAAVVHHQPVAGDVLQSQVVYL